MALGLEERASLGWIALLRLAGGLVFLEAAVRKLRAGFDAAQLSAQLTQWQQAGLTLAFVREPLAQLVLPRLALFAALVVAGELAAGALLTLGLASRVGALVALVLHASYFLASGELLPLVFVPIDLAVLVTGGGRALGLDALIRRKRPGFFLG